jgi:hypothetical protein
MAEFTYPQLALPTLALLGLTSLLILIGRDWRWILAALAFQYLGAFVLVTFSWPVTLAWVKLVGGWMACLLMAAAVWNTPPGLGEESFAPSGRIFRTIAAGLVGLVVYATTRSLQAWLPEVDSAVVVGSLILIEMGLLHLAITSQPLRMTIGLLTVFTGFEIIYAAVENSALVAGLLAGFTIGLALVGAYMLIAPGLEKEPE